MVCSSPLENHLARRHADKLRPGEFLSAKQALQVDERLLALRGLVLTLKRKNNRVGYEVRTFSRCEPCPGCMAPGQVCQDCHLYR
jgi:hypothetical protein